MPKAAGVPTFIAPDGELFYGQDRLPDLALHLDGGGPAAYLAVVIDGVEPQGSRAKMREFVLDLHVRHEGAMKRYQGDPATLPDLSATMIAIPPIATAIAAHVAGRTGSRSTIHPSTAAMKGAVANNNMALATDVFWIA